MKGSMQVESRKSDRMEGRERIPTFKVDDRFEELNANEWMHTRWNAGCRRLSKADKD